MYLTIGRGRGYSPAEENKTEDQPLGRDPDRLDLLADPARVLRGRLGARRSAHRLRQARRWRSRPTARSSRRRALREAAEILIKSLAIFTDADRVEELTSRDGAGAAEAAFAPLAAGEGDDRLIEELEIGVRAYNCLKRAGIQTVGDLVQRSESELNAIPNFGKRSTEEVIEALQRSRPLAPRRVAGSGPGCATARRRHKLSRDSAHRKALAAQPLAAR